jgi:hypothetical protein
MANGPWPLCPCAIQLGGGTSRGEGFGKLTNRDDLIFTEKYILLSKNLR